MLPIAKQSWLGQPPIEPTALPAKSVRRGRILFCLGANYLIVAMLVALLAPVEQWLPLLGSVALLAVAVVSVINHALDVAVGHYGNARYQLQLTEQKVAALREELNAVRRIDEISGCFNEAVLREEIERCIAMSKRSGYRFSVLAVSIDQYVEVLGRHGQRGSNDMLEVFGSILRRSVREVDTVARIESERFLVVLSDSVDDEAMIVADRIMDLSRQIHIHGCEDISVTVSMGLSSFAGHEDVDRLIEQAGIALQFAIDEGGDSIAGYLHKTEDDDRLAAAG